MKYVLLTLLLIIPISSTIFSQQKELDSLITITNSITDSLHIKTATDFIYELSKQENYELGLVYCDTFIKISKSIKHLKGVGLVYTEKANIFNITDKSQEALQAYDLAENYFKSSKHNRGVAVVNNNKAIIQHRLGNLEKSIDLLLQASVYYNKLEDSISLADTYNNIGNVYKSLKKFDQAKEHYKKSIQIKRKNKRSNLASSLNNLALTHIDIKETDSAITILNEALEESKKQNDSRSMAGVYIALAKIYLEKADYQKSKEYFNASMFIGGKVEFASRLITIKHGLALIAINTKKYKEAEQHLNEARHKAEELNYQKQLLTNYKYAVQLATAQGNETKAKQWEKKYSELLKKEQL